MYKEKKILIYERVAQRLKKENKTIYQMQKDLNMRNVNFSDWKSGRSMPKMDKLIPIAKYVGLSFEELIS